MPPNHYPRGKTGCMVPWYRANHRTHRTPRFGGRHRPNDLLFGRWLRDLRMGSWPRIAEDWVPDARASRQDELSEMVFAGSCLPSCARAPLSHGRLDMCIFLRGVAVFLAVKWKVFVGCSFCSFFEFVSTGSQKGNWRLLDFHNFCSSFR